MPNLNKITVDAFQFYLDEYFPFNIYKNGDNFSIASKSARPNTATGLTSFAVGTNTVASEQFTVAMGAHTQATASAAVALGAFCQANGGNSFAMGNTSKAQNNCAIALGKEIQAKGQYQTAVGAFNDFSNTEAKFIVGAGSSNNDRRNAFTTGIDSNGAYITIGNDKKFYASSILTAETDPTVPAWAKAPNPPTCPVTSVNDKTGDIVLNLADLSTDANHRVVTDAEKQAWNSKSNFSGSYNELTNKPTLFDGNYNSLSNKPIFTNVSLNWGETKTFATIGETKYTISIPTLNLDPEGESIGMATPTTLGIVKSAQNRNVSLSLTTGGTTANRYYGVELDADGTMFVNVPWIEGTSSSVTVTNKGATLGWGKDSTIATINGTDITLKMPQNPDTNTNYYHTPLFNSGLQIATGTGVNNAYIPYAGISQYGVVKPKAIRNASISAVTGQTATNRYYGVELDSNGQMFVNIPWVEGTSGSSDLPAVSTSDNGKFLRVENGAWQAVQVSVYNGEIL